MLSPIPDSRIFAAVITTLNAGLASRNIKGVKVQQWYQPRIVGAPLGYALLLSNVSDHDHGFLGRYTANTVSGNVKPHREVQATEITLQCTGSVKQPAPPKPLLPMTSGDLAKTARRIIMSDAGRLQLRALGFGIERIIDVRQPHFKDESDQFEQVASFDFTLAFNQVEESTVPIANGPPVVKIVRV